MPESQILPPPIVTLDLTTSSAENGMISLSGVAYISYPHIRDILLITEFSGVGDGYQVGATLYIPAGETSSQNIGDYTSPYIYTSPSILYAEFDRSIFVTQVVQAIELDDLGEIVDPPIVATQVKLDGEGIFSDGNSPVELYINAGSDAENNIVYSGELYRDYGYSTAFLSLITLNNPAWPSSQLYELWISPFGSYSETVGQYVSPVVITTTLPKGSVDHRLTTIQSAIVLEYNDPENEFEQGRPSSVNVAVSIDAHIVNIIPGEPFTTPEPTPSASAEPDVTPTPTPTSTPTSAAPEPTPSASAEPDVTPTPTPTVTPSNRLVDNESTPVIPPSPAETLNSILQNARELSFSTIVAYPGTTARELFAYKITNNSENTVNTVTEFINYFDGKVELYNEGEFIKNNFYLDSASSFLSSGDINMYHIFPEYYEDVYNFPILSFPISTDYLDNISTENTATPSVVFKSTIMSGKSMYILVETQASAFTFNHNTIVEPEPIALPEPSEPETTEPSFGDVITIKGSGVYDLSLSQDIINSLDNTPLKVSVYGDTDKVIQVIITYGAYSTSSNYLYNPELVTDVEGLLEELRYVTGDPYAQLYPMSGQSVDNQHSLLDIDILCIEGAKVDIKVNSPIDNSRFNMALKASTATSDPLEFNDPYAEYARPGESGTTVWERLKHLGYF